MALQQAELPEIAAWRIKLEGLYEEIRAWVAEMDPAPTVEPRTFALNEKRSGVYEVPGLAIRRGEGEFEVRPIAKWVVGGDGRVDLIGGDGPFTLIWLQQAGAKIRVPSEFKLKVEIRDVDGWFWTDDNPPWLPRELTGELFRGLAETCLE